MKPPTRTSQGKLFKYAERWVVINVNGEIGPHLYLTKKAAEQIVTNGYVQRVNVTPHLKITSPSSRGSDY